MLQSTIRSSKSISESGEPFQRQGSLRRVLPTAHNKDNLFGRQNEDINEFYKVVHQEYIILAEYEMVVSEKFKGIYAIPSNESSFVWFGVVFVRSGLFEDGVFRFNILLPEAFPDGDHPKVIFQTEVNHPVINSNTNELYLLNGFPTWNKSDQHIWQVLKYVQWIFHNFKASISHAVDQECIDLYKNDLESFKAKAKDCVKYSQDHLYDPPDTMDIHYITFERYDHDIHDSVRSEIMRKNDDRPTISGHSWVARGNFKPLSRAPTPDSDS